MCLRINFTPNLSTPLVHGWLRESFDSPSRNLGSHPVLGERAGIESFFFFMEIDY